MRNLMGVIALASLIASLFVLLHFKEKSWDWEIEEWERYNTAWVIWGIASLIDATFIWKVI